MREQLKLLEELQVLDLQLLESEEALTALPSKLQSMKDDVQSVELLLEGDQQRLTETRAYRDELQQAIEHDRELLNKAKIKLAAVRTSKEYMAVQREFETNRKLTSEREEEFTKLDTAVKESEAAIEEKQGQLADLEQHVTEEAKEIEAELAKVEQANSGKREAREEKAQLVQKALARKYDRIRRLRGGIGVVRAAEGACSGCHMRLPPQLYNILQRNETIEQ
ncbi:MAG: hypothetical protein JRH20_31210, partial [Deltaproteobacteria bacterium]|nr:hypothetical protein [Deltaproteobacteria bacterium]